MPQQDLELARAGYEAWSRGDLEALLAIFHEDIEFWTSGLFPGLEPVYRGHEGVRNYWEDFRSPWKSLRIAIDRFHQKGDRIVALGEFEAVGRDGLTVHRPAANVLTIRNGLAIRITAHASWKAALEAAGLSEQEVEG
jgi:ketosteroid isomerase-like protein